MVSLLLFLFLSCTNILSNLFLIVYLCIPYLPCIHNLCLLAWMPFFLLATWLHTVYIYKLHFFSLRQLGSVLLSYIFVSPDKFTPHCIFWRVEQITHIMRADLIDIWLLCYPIFHSSIGFHRHKSTDLLFHNCDLDWLIIENFCWSVNNAWY